MFCKGSRSSLSRGPAALSLWTYPVGLEFNAHPKFNTWMFIGALFTLPKIGSKHDGLQDVKNEWTTVRGDNRAWHATEKEMAWKWRCTSWKRACLEGYILHDFNLMLVWKKKKPWASDFQELRCGRKKGWGLGSLLMVHRSSNHILFHICPGLQTVQMQGVHPDAKCGLCVRQTLASIATTVFS